MTNPAQYPTGAYNLGLPTTRFFRLLSVGRINECWEWTGRLNSKGYGVFTVGSSTAYSAHKWLWELLFGPVPEGMVLDHMCHNKTDCNLGKHCPHRRCGNPFHLRVTTPKENTQASPNYLGRRTECKWGHPYVEGSYYMGKVGRICYVCQLMRSAIQNESRKVERAPAVAYRQAHCRQGHLLTEENTYLITRANGTTFRRCKTCALKKDRARRAAEKLARLPRKLSTHCKQGHLYTDDSTVFHANGRRSCRICRNEAQRKRRASSV